MKQKKVAELTVNKISQMTPEGREAIISWLRQQASNIKKYHKKPGFSKVYKAIYLSDV